jgi:hypothetical protein
MIGPGRPQKAHLDLDRRRELVHAEQSKERRAHRVVKHRCKEPALNRALRVAEFRARRVSHADMAGFQFQCLPPKQSGCRRGLDNPSGNRPQDI